MTDIYRLTIERERDAALAAGAPWNGYQWHCDDSFRVDLIDLLDGLQLGYLTEPQRVRDKAGTVHELTGTEILQLRLTVGLYRKTVLGAAWNADEALGG